jgi:AraC-like DNA-binding protein/quercetin dioxygenase-like cupin family protein
MACQMKGESRMYSKEPERLTNERYLGTQFPVQMYSQLITGSVGMHWHEFYELCFIVRGKGTNVVNGKAILLEPGCLFLLTPADFHEIAHDPTDLPIELFNVVFSEELLSEGLRDLVYMQRDSCSIKEDESNRPEVEQEYRLIGAELEHRRTGYQVLIRGALERIVVSWIRGLERGELSNLNGEAGATQPSAMMQKAMNYIRYHFRDPLTLEDAARHARLAPNYFSDCFRKMTGIAFQNYLQELRLSFASSLLRASSLPVTDICYASGFRTLTHFERVFKRKYGHSPRAYRKELGTHLN